MLSFVWSKLLLSYTKINAIPITYAAIQRLLYFMIVLIEHFINPLGKLTNPDSLTFQSQSMYTSKSNFLFKI